MKSGLFIKNLCKLFFSKDQSHFTYQIIDAGVLFYIIYYFIIFG